MQAKSFGIFLPDGVGAMTTLGIDPGMTGALVWVRGGELLKVADMPTKTVKSGGKNRTTIDLHLLAYCLEESPQPEYVFLEQVSSMPGQGSTSTFGFGRSYGTLEGALGVKAFHSWERWLLRYVKPQVWQKEMGVVGKAKDPESGHRKVLELWPEDADFFERKKDNGRVDAALIAMYGETMLSIRSSADTLES